MLYVSRSFVQNHLSSVFHIHSFVCPYFICIHEPALSQSLMTFKNSKLWKCMLQSSLQIAPLAIVTRP